VAGFRLTARILTPSLIAAPFSAYGGAEADEGRTG
jgi:hypothetical protein